VFEAAAQALGLILQLDRLGWMVLGCAVGLVVGLLPGLGGTVGMSILLPFIFGMDPYSGVALLIGMAAVIHTGDTFPAVLIGVPGSAGSQATIVDGYPLARQGKAATALSAAFFVSMIGGIFGAVVLFGTLSVARPLVLALGSPELFMLAIFGLSMVGVLSVGSPLAGVISGLAGLLIGTIGGAPGVPVYRYTFDWLYLFDGIPLPVLALGLFAVPEMLDLLAQRGHIAQGAKLAGSRLDGIREALRHKLLILRSAALGSALGIVPGIGGSVVDWIAYGVTKQTARDRDNFGRGDILRNAALQFDDGARVEIDSLFENCQITLGRGTELIIAERGVLADCQIRGEGMITVHGKFYEKDAVGIIGPRRLVVTAGGAVVSTVHSSPNNTAFAFERGCSLRMKILKPTSDSNGRAS